MTNNRLVSASVSDRGLSKKRPQNEDSFLEIPQSGIFAVADGVGGASAGEVASEMAVEILAEAFTHMTPGSDAEEVMRVALTKANEAIFQMSHDLPSLSSMASTVVALHIDGEIATIGHVGDSRLYRLGVDGQLYQETADHSVVAEEVRAGRMTPEQAENHPSRNIISRALGAEPMVEVELKTIMFEPGTSFLICSDGVTRHVPDAEIRAILSAGAEPSSIADHIKELCYQRGAEDNLTAVIVKTLPQPADDIGQNDGALPVFAHPSLEPDSPYATVADVRMDADDLESPTRELAFPEVGNRPGPFDETAAEQHDDFDVPPTIPLDASIVPPITAQRAATADLGPSQTDGGYSEQKRDSYPTSPAPPPRHSYDDFTDTVSEKKESGTFRKVVSSVLLLLVGSLFGLLGYHFVLLPFLNQQSTFPLPKEMKSSNEPLTAFEESRRTVDQSPKEALDRFGASPEDAEDYFLVGRAHLLLGQYQEARSAFGVAQEKIAAGNVDPKNVKTIQTEIAIYSAVTSDTTIQGILKKNLDSTRSAINSNVPANR